MARHVHSLRWIAIVALMLVGSGRPGLVAQPAPNPTQPALSKEQQERLKERDRYGKEVVEFRKRGKLAEALAACRKMLAIERAVLGENHEDVIGSLEELADIHEKRQDFAAARQARQEVLALRRKQHGEPHWQVTDARLALAHVETLARLTADERRQLEQVEKLDGEESEYYRQKKYHEAARLRRQSLAIRQKVLGPEHPDIATSLNNLGYFLQAQWDYAGARPYYEQALTIRKKVLGNEHPDTAFSLNSLGNLLNAQGDYAKARPYYEQALAIRKKALGPEHPDTATSLNNLGDLFKSQGDYAGARPYYEQALAIRKKVLGTEHSATAASLNNLGLLLSAQGDYTGAQAYLEQALAICKKVLGPEHPDTATSLNNLGGVLYLQRDYVGARPYYEQALAIQKKVRGPDHPDTATSLNNLGLLLQAQRDYTGARPYFEQALAITKKLRGPNHPDTATSLNNLGGLLAIQKHYAEAQTYYEQALAIRQKMLGPDHLDTAQSLHNMGYVLYLKGDYAEAHPYYEQALAIKKKVRGPDHPDLARSLNILGVLLSSQGDYAGARPYYEQALALTRQSLDLAASSLSERQQLAVTRSWRSYLDDHLSLIPHIRMSGAQAYQPVLTWKGAILARQQRQRLARTDPATADLFRQLDSTNNRLAKLAFAASAPKQREVWRQQMEDLTREKEKLERDLSRQSAAFLGLRKLQRLTPEQLQQALPAGTALIDFLEYTQYSPPPEKQGPLNREQHLAAFVIRPERPVVQLDLGPAKPITVAVDTWRQHLGRVKPAEGADPAQELRRRLWEPLLPHLKDAQVVLISPDGALTRCPFAALPGQKLGTYLIEEQAIAVVPVPQLLPQLLDRKAATPVKEPSLLVVGGVDYGALPDKGETVADGRSAPRGGRADLLQKWKPLPGARAEVGVVRDYFEERFPGASVKVLRNDQATESALRALAPKHRYLHLATHGFFAPTELKSALAVTRTEQSRPGDLFAHKGVADFHPGLLSGLVLAGANRPAVPGHDDGILTALEVAVLDLSGVDLAVLSACDTGLGETAGGEGLLGLQRAFQVAGASSVVASLWAVDDRATRLLMADFYDNLWKRKLSKVEALRQAQLSTLREGRQRNLEPLDKDSPRKPLPPYFWAGFVLSGDWR